MFFLPSKFRLFLQFIYLPFWLNFPSMFCIYVWVSSILFDFHRFYHRIVLLLYRLVRLILSRPLGYFLIICLSFRVFFFTFSSLGSARNDNFLFFLIMIFFINCTFILSSRVNIYFVVLEAVVFQLSIFCISICAMPSRLELYNKPTAPLQSSKTLS